MHALFGERLEALRLVQQAVDCGFFVYPRITADPFLDSFHDDSAFQQLLATARARPEAFRALVSAEGMAR
jgi:hypothetical protein